MGSFVKKNGEKKRKKKDEKKEWMSYGARQLVAR